MVKAKYEGLGKWQKAVVWIVVVGSLSFSGAYLSSGAIRAHEAKPELNAMCKRIDKLEEINENRRSDVEDLKVGMGRLEEKMVQVIAGFEKLSGQIEREARYDRNRDQN